MNQELQIRKIQVNKQRWSEAVPMNSSHLAKFQQQQPAYISKMVTRLLGTTTKSLPLMYATEGKRGVKEIENGGITYRYPVEGDIEREERITVAPDTPFPGKGHSIFYLGFKEQNISREHGLVMSNGQRLRVQDEATYRDGNYFYPVILQTGNAEEYADLSHLQVGKYVSETAAPVSTYGSRGTNTNFTAGYEVEGQITTMRKSYRYEGNLPEFRMKFEMKTSDNRKVISWMDYMEWQFNYKHRLELEDQFWYGVDNRNSEGKVMMTDDFGNPIHIGDGVLNQITNKLSYFNMTERLLHNKIRDVYSCLNDAEQKNLILWTGMGGLEIFDRAMKNRELNYTLVSSDFIKSNSNGKLTATGYFDTYRHIAGHTITVVHNPLFDTGKLARTQKRNGEIYNNLPYESYRMVFVDNSIYDGRPNMEMLGQKGRSSLRWFVPGGGNLPKGYSGNGDFRASELDSSSIHLMTSKGVVLYRGNTSFDFRFKNYNV